jgi:hypothetical protein
MRSLCGSAHLVVIYVIRNLRLRYGPVVSYEANTYEVTKTLQIPNILLPLYATLFFFFTQRPNGARRICQADTCTVTEFEYECENDQAFQRQTILLFTCSRLVLTGSQVLYGYSTQYSY